ncbi:tRNA guanosine(34) transglycosylase Tgt [Acidobacteria bacterium AH-259-O06]|nr:tRNA guanosine(34) transglycosylase Tgt [Acidobacteria bacterium AH-259-O06]
MPVSFQVLARDEKTDARSGVLQTPHGDIETPVFVPVGTAGTVKAMPHELLEKLDARIILANTYHLYLRPGQEVILRQGGLHRFMSWNRAILTDSGGYQVFSHQALRKITEEGVEFQSHLDGSYHFISPEKSIQIQQTLGSDIIMVFDECTPYPVTEREARESMRRSVRWAQRCKSAYQGGRQALFGIVQGSVFFELRKESLERLCEIDFAGLALGGFSVGEPKLLMYEMIEHLNGLMPGNKPRYLMGVGTPLDLLSCVKQGMDMFDCVLPTRNARNGTLFTSVGRISIKNARYRDDEGPLDPNCKCLVCRRYSRSYLRHLYISGEIVSSILNTYHNVFFYLDFMRKIRNSIALNSLSELEERFREQYAE